MAVFAVTRPTIAFAAPGGVVVIGRCRLRDCDPGIFGSRRTPFPVVAAFAPAEERRAVRTLPLYRLAVSAGTGELLDGTDYDTVEVGDEVSPNADFGVRIAGDSMEPRFVHGQIVWVHRQETLRSGEIGVFLYNGAGYCKRLEYAAGRVELVSLNPRYAPIRVAEGDELRVFGRVVG